MSDLSALRIGYLSSEYPGISHTFIHREVVGLRERGARVFTASIRRPAHLEAMTDAERCEAQDTMYVKSAGVAGALRAHWRLVRGSPLGWLRMLRRALALGLAGPGLLRGLFYFAEAGVLLEWMRAKRLAHVHVHFANPAATVAMIGCEYGTAGFSLSVHGPDVFYDVVRNLLAQKVSRALFVRSISHYCSSQLMRLVGHGQWGKIHIVRCGVDPERFAPRPDPGGGAPVFLCVGRLVPAKGQHLLVEALARLRQAGLEFRAVFLGGGPDLESLQALALSLGLSGLVEFTGPVGQDEVRRRYAQASVFVLPSFAEGVPVVLMEAMAMEIPCVTTRITGVPELVEDGVGGLLVAPGDVEGLAGALERLAGDAALRRRLGRAGRKAVLARYDIRENAPAMGELFARYLPGGGA